MAGRNQIAYRAFGHIPGEGITLPPTKAPFDSASATPKPLTSLRH
jgi:hypothetical protein